MSNRLYLTVYARDDMNGASLGTVDEATELSYQDTLHGTGSGRVRMYRHHAQAALLLQDRYVRVHSDAGVIGAFFLEEGVIDLSSDQEGGGEFITWTGRGPLAVLETAVMDNDSDIVGGHDPIDGFWDLSNQGPLAGDSSAHPITMFKRAVVEAKLQTPTGLGGVDHSSFTYDEDSNGAPLVFIDGEWGVNVGDDLLTVLAKLDQIGGVTFRMSTDFELSAWLTYGTDRSGAFGAGNVRFEKGVNIATSIDRTVRGGVTRTHLIVGGADRVFVTVTDPDYSTGDVIRWGFLSVPESSNESALESAGLAHIEARKRQTDVWLIPAHDHGDNEAAGIYEPGDHYFVGDTVTVHTGTGAYDANGEASAVASVTWELKTGDAANGDYQVSLEVGSTFHWTGNQGFDSPGSQHVACPLCLSFPTPGTEGTCTRLYFSLTDAGLGAIAEDTSWANDATVNPQLLKLTTDSSISTGGSTDLMVGVNVAAGSYVRDAGGDAYQITSAGFLASIQAGGLLVRAQIRNRSRNGIGISEAAQDNYPTWLARVYRAGTGYIGTLFSLTGGGTKFIAQSTFVNRTWTATTSAVASAALNDWVVFEIGSRHVGPITGGTGAYALFTNAAASDLPEDEVSTAGLNSWIDICTAGTAGSAPIQVVHSGAGSYGTSTEFVPVGSTVEHGLLSTDELHYHDALDVEYDPTTSGIEANNVQEAIDELASSGVTALDDLTDVTITAPAEGDMLRYNGSAWVDTPGRWEVVTNGTDILVWDGVNLLHEWTDT